MRHLGGKVSVRERAGRSCAASACGARRCLEGGSLGEEGIDYRGAIGAGSVGEVVHSSLARSQRALNFSKFGNQAKSSDAGV